MISKLIITSHSLNPTSKSPHINCNASEFGGCKLNLCRFPALSINEKVTLITNKRYPHSRVSGRSETPAHGVEGYKRVRTKNYLYHSSAGARQQVREKQLKCHV